jgi:hypothetical protein
MVLERKLATISATFYVQLYVLSRAMKEGKM